MHDLKDKIKIFTGNANIALAQQISNILAVPLSSRDLGQFADGEIRCEILEHVRDSYVFIIQSTCNPVNDNLMELCVMIDAFKRQGVSKIISVIPYYGYSRQDRKPGYSRTPITSKLVADMLQVAGSERIITLDIHSEQQSGFFNIPVINLGAAPELIADIWRYHYNSNEKVVIVSPDTGGVVRARSVAKQLDDADLAIIDKRRPAANVSEVMNLIGDVAGCKCIIIDDLIDTAGTLCKAAVALKNNGATYVAAYATHPVFSGNAVKNIQESVLDEIVVANTIPLSAEMEAIGKVRQISIASLLAETIYRVSSHKSVSAMYTGT
jgi:ribose-phosphate pyrophosphokinase